MVEVGIECTCGVALVVVLGSSGGCKETARRAGLLLW